MTTPSGSNSLPFSLPLRLGLTMWSHNLWQQSFYGSGTQNSERLARYAEVFHTVEGNTTFYAVPNAQTVQNWRAATHDEFRFTFKLPKNITHQHLLSGCHDLLREFLTIMSPLHDRIGQWSIQLPASFGPEHLPILKQFCRQFPSDMPLGVEVRHLAFFAKGEAEQQLNQFLHQQSIDRIIMDSRPVFAAPPTSEAVTDAHNKKPKVPVHAIATAKRPMVRFIGHPDLDANLAFFQPWLAKLPQWMAEGIQPYLMIHTPDNQFAPELALKLYQALQAQLAQLPITDNAQLPDLAPFPAIRDSQQIRMF